MLSIYFSILFFKAASIFKFLHGLNLECNDTTILFKLLRVKNSRLIKGL